MTAGESGSAYDGKYFSGTGSGYRDGYERAVIGPVMAKYAAGLKALYSPARALDVGCAKGFLVEALVKLGVDAYGCDISEFAIRNSPPGVRERLFRLDASGGGLPFPDRHFDLVASLQTFEHIREHDGLLREILRVLEPRGVLFVEVPTPGNPGRDVTHVNVLPRERWLELFGRFGFRPLDRDIVPYLRRTEEEAAAIPVGAVGRVLRAVGLRDRLLRVKWDRESRALYRRNNYQFHLQAPG